MTFAPAKEGALQTLVSLGSIGRLSETRMAGDKAGHRIAQCEEVYFTALLIAAARSVFSQEKPPSFSGARPKWP